MQDKESKYWDCKRGCLTIEKNPQASGRKHHFRTLLKDIRPNGKYVSRGYNLSHLVYITRVKDGFVLDAT